MTPVALAMGALTVLVAVMFVAAVGAAGRDGRSRTPSAAVLVLAWLAITGGAAWAGLLDHFDRTPPPIVPLLLAAAIVALRLATSETGRRVLEVVPLWAVVLSQGFRLPLELTMHRAAEAGLMPVQMSYAGWNYDIVTGAAALVVGILAWQGRAPRRLIVAWNALGSVTLAVVVTIAAVSMPAVHAFGTEPARLNTWVARFPYVWLPTVLVPAALFAHALVWRACRSPRTPAAAAAR